MPNLESSLRAGDWVEVKSSLEIAQMLDADGTTDGLPFMPEMLAACGHRFQVGRRVEKSCVEFAGGVYKIRDIVLEGLVLLDDLRCSGADHDGCQRGCVVFWSSKWLQKVDHGQTGKSGPFADDHAALLRPRLKTTTAPGRYFCQSTQLAGITRPLTRGRILRKCVRDVWSGSRGVMEMIRLMALPLWRKLFPRQLTGSQKRTPVGELGLQPGEVVELKSANEIVETLDAYGRNRGLLVDYNAICRFKGGRYRVRTRMERMISEATGEMCHLKNTVILEGISCASHSVVGGCPRQDAVYWREIWLKRVTGDQDAGKSQPTVG